MTAAVKDVMTTQVIWVEQDTPFAAIASALRQHRASAFPVLNEAGEVIGVVSESDLLNKMALGGGEDHMPGMIGGILRHKQLEKARGVTAAELMTAPPVTVSPEDTIEHAARLMYMRGVKRLPVVGVDGHLAGIVSRSDVLAIYGRSDAEIAEDIRTSVLSTEEPAVPGAFDVAVTEGVATLVGRPQTREQGHEIAFRTRHIQGVVAVRDRLEYPAPGPDAFDVVARFPAD
jgi:CBS domain-containing protein